MHGILRSPYLQHSWVLSPATLANCYMAGGMWHVGAATAIKLEQLLDIPADYWMRVQVYHDLFVERNKSSEAA